jgi:hypothetical protein
LRCSSIAVFEGSGDEMYLRNDTRAIMNLHDDQILCSEAIVGFKIGCGGPIYSNAKPGGGNVAGFSF